MLDRATPTPEEIRAFVQDHPNLRARDIAQKLSIAEAQLVAAGVGINATRIAPHPDGIIAAAEQLGEVMALTRVGDCVHEKVGEYGNYHPGEHAAMTLTEEIDLRIFPRHWVHAYAVETLSDAGPKRSLQVFDAAGDAVHKIHLRETSRQEMWPELIAGLAMADQSAGQEVTERAPSEPAKSRPEKTDVLRHEWSRMTDTHQFLRLCSKLKMNRLGAYRVAGAPFVRALDPGAADAMLMAVRDAGINIMFFVGNRGCIQIHTGPIQNLRPMGPWQNVMDERFNLHLRLDTVAEVWAVEKPTQRGPAVSVEAFDAQGGLIFQVFGVGKEGQDSREDWGRIVAALPDLQEGAA